MLNASARGAWDVLADELGRYIGRRLPLEEAEDVRQDVMLRIFTNSSQLNDVARFGPWVYSIARNAVIDRLRAKGVPTAELDQIPEPEASPEPEAQPLLNCVTSFVARLPSPYREAITLTELRGLTQQQAADVEGVSLSGMKSRVQRGRKLLKTMFEECCQLTLDGRQRVIDARPHVRRECAQCPDD
jgi:RNA polymerase sigma-70 factor (ECF subfamily)